MFPIYSLIGLITLSVISMWFWADYLDDRNLTLEGVESAALRRFILLTIAPADIVIRIAWCVEDLWDEYTETGKLWRDTVTENWDELLSDYKDAWRGVDGV